MIGRRKRLLSYLRNISEERYAALIARLGIRG
jgi:small subunit ribosomal protein S15